MIMPRTSRGGEEMTKREKLVKAQTDAYKVRDDAYKAWVDADKALDAYDREHPEEAKK